MSDEDRPGVSTDVAYDNLMNKFQYDQFDSAHPGTKHWSLNYANLYGRVAEALLLENKNEMAMSLLNNYLSHFEDKIFPYDLILFSFIESYYKLSEFEKGNAIATLILQNLKTNRIPVYNNATPYPQDLKDSFISNLKSLAQTYNQDTVIPFNE